MIQRDYDKYLKIMLEIHKLRTDWYIVGAPLLRDILQNEQTPYAYALVELAPKICAAILKENKKAISADSLINGLYDPNNAYNLNYNAYHFVTRIVGDVLGVDVGISVQSIGGSFSDLDSLLYDYSDNDPDDVRALKMHRSRLLDFGRTNQLVNFRKYEKSSIEISYPSAGDLLNQLLGNEKIYIEHWETLGLNQISECKYCGSQFFRQYKKKDASTSTRCPLCDEKKKGTKSGKPVKEAPYDLAVHPLVLTCQHCSTDNVIKKAPTEQVSCRKCKAHLRLPSYPVFNSGSLKSKFNVYCVASNSDTTTQKAASVLNRRTRSLEINFGLHPLYLACGFLKWKSRIDRQENLSPLLLVKINLFLDSSKGKYYIVIDNTDDEPIALNRTLKTMLKRYSLEHSIEIPGYVEGMSYFDYKMSILEKLKDYPIAADWTIENRAAIGIFNYQKLQLEKDITDNFDEYLNHPMIRLIGGLADDNAAPVASVGGNEDFLVLDADGSQSEVIDAAVSGKSFILQGPPGSGKSQTITNIIAGAMSVGKTVLFVTEKASARNIIWDNLSEIRLDGDRSLAEFIYNPSNMVTTGSGNRGARADRDAPSKEAFKNFYNERFSIIKQPIGMTTEILSLDHITDKVKSLYKALDSKVGNNKLSELISIWSQYAEAKNLDVAGEIGSTSNDLQQLSDDLSMFYRFTQKFGLRYTDHPLFGYTEKNPDIPSLTPIEKALALKGELYGYISVLDKTTGISLSKRFNELNDETFILKKWSALPGIIFTWAAESGLPLAADVTKLHALLQNKNKYLKSRWDMHTKALALRSAAADFEKTVSRDEYDFDFRSLYNSFTAFRNPFKRLGKEYKSLREFLRSKLADINQKLSYKTLMAILPGIVEDQEAYRKCREHEGLFERDGAEFSGIANGWDTDWEQISKILGYALKTIVARPSRVDNQVCNYLRGVRSFDAASENIMQTAEKINDCVKELLLQIDRAEPAFKQDLFNRNDYSYQDRFEIFSDVVDHREDLIEWTRFCVFLESINNKTALNAVIARLTKMGISDVDEAERMLKKAYYQKLIMKELVKAGRNLTIFDSIAHTALLGQYQKIDIDQMHKDAVETYNNLTERKKRVCSGYPGSRLITNIRGLSVKSILKDKWSFIKAITPCFMMSPLSVSQYLDINNKFDMVIFDEASQIFLEDSLASIVRGSQVIISGDLQQLPPSDFFRASDFESEDATLAFDDQVKKSGRSVLDASNERSGDTIKPISLKWHYRSRDESLISFSNQQFYDGNLVTFPAAMQDPELRLVYHPVDGIYQSGRNHTNPREAEAVVDFIWSEINNPSRRRFTIGVVAFSVAQAHEIEDQWLSFVSSLSPEDKAIYQEWEDMEEHKKDPLIFCNLDTIQGDERDTMIVSTTYGKNEHDEFNLLYLGPVRQEGGGKRINVAITRARARMVVVTSMTYELLKSYIDKSSGKNNDGAAILRDFLRYAESYDRSRRSKGSSSSRQAPTTFVKSICAILDECGADYDVNVGLSNYKIEIAVKSPKNPNHYVLGIMTDEDGLNKQTVREYARLRPQVLTKRYGWNLYRVWTLGWFLNYKEEKQRLIKAVEAAMKN